MCIVGSTGLIKKEVNAVFEIIAAVLEKSLGQKGQEVYAVSRLMKLAVQRKPAIKARKGSNPFTVEETMVKVKRVCNMLSSTT